MIKFFEKLRLMKITKKLALNRFHLLLMVALVVGLVSSIFVFNMLENNKDVKLEITFVTPREAIVFWTTDYETIGYVKYGNSKNYQVAYQTSSQPGYTHAVLLEDIPLDGFFVSLHAENDSFFRWPKKTKVVFDPTTIE